MRYYSTLTFHFSAGFAGYSTEIAECQRPLHVMMTITEGTIGLPDKSFANLKKGPAKSQQSTLSGGPRVEGAIQSSAIGVRRKDI